MKKLLLLLVLVLIGTGGGIGAGLLLARPAEPEALIVDPCGDPDPGEETIDTEQPVLSNGPLQTEGKEYARLNNQFVVPVVRDGRVTSLVVLSLSLEVEQGKQEHVFAHEPRLRDLFLQVLFDHANMGGFDGSFTAASSMRILRDGLRDAAVRSIGGGITDVLIIEIVRQDIAG